MAAVVFVIATAVIALWIDVRFPGLAPAELMRIGIHLAVAFVASTLVAPFVSDAIIGTGLPLARLAGLFVVLAALCYVFLTAIWVIKAAQGPMRSMMR
jgi:hypothetical protein